MPAPNFLIIGERRSGTTTLARWIQEHPQIYLHPQMDIGYFLDSELVGAKKWKVGPVDYTKWELLHSKKEYESKFPVDSDCIAIGEKSADYLFWQPCHERIKKYYPNIKLIITIRNPTERAWSMYWNEFGKGRETLSFEEAIEKEEERVKSSDYALDHLSYISRGHYAKSIKHLLQHFDKKNIHVIVLESLIVEPKKHVSELYDFLNVDPSQGFDNIEKKFNKNWTLVQKKMIKSNKFLSYFEEIYFKVISEFSFVVFRGNIYKRRKLISFLASPFRKGKDDQRMSEKVRKKLQAHFAPLNRELEELLQIDLNRWS